jgi:hypothetical protein
MTQSMNTMRKIIKLQVEQTNTLQKGQQICIQLNQLNQKLAELAELLQDCDGQQLRQLQVQLLSIALERDQLTIEVDETTKKNEQLEQEIKKLSSHKDE